VKDRGHSVPSVSSEQSRDVLEQDITWSKDAKALDDVIEQPPRVLCSLLLTGITYWLTREACRYHVNLLELLPI
jgi:hypothetical protein